MAPNRVMEMNRKDEFYILKLKLTLPRRRTAI
jgi:hypothetical protein